MACEHYFSLTQRINKTRVIVYGNETKTLTFALHFTFSRKQGKPACKLRTILGRLSASESRREELSQAEFDYAAVRMYVLLLDSVLLVVCISMFAE